MKVSIEHLDPQIDSEIAKAIIEPVTQALNRIVTVGNQFVVNPSHWYWINPKMKVRPSVVNSAAFLSTHFQNNLQELGWFKEKTIQDQKIDAYIEMPSPLGHAEFSLPAASFIPLLNRMSEDDPEGFGLGASEIFLKYVRGSETYLRNDLIPYKDLFAAVSSKKPIRVGLEFETGNIASSFRAFQKLDLLSVADEIDIGVFVTSLNKADCATKIWPVSNRNGSFEELKKRRYHQQRIYRAIDIGFAPDGFSASAPYLGDDGKTYEILETAEQIVLNGTPFIKGSSARGTVFREA